MARRKWYLAAAAGFVLFIALAGVGYDLFVVTRHQDRSRLAQLVVSDPPPGYTKKPSGSNQVTASDNPFAAYQASAKRHPTSTGAYSISWANPRSSDDSATFLVSYLPSASAAGQVQAQAAQRFLAADGFKAQKYAYSQAIQVPGVPGARAAAYIATGTAKTPPVVATVFSTGRVQVFELVGQTGTPQSTGAVAAALAHSEYVHLLRTLPGFSLGVTSIPTTATVVYWVVAGGIVCLAVGIPLGIRRTRRIRDDRLRRSAQRQHQVRGSKIARRQAARRR
jgi:hypothetical protein